MSGKIMQGVFEETVGENPEILSHNISNKISNQNSSLSLEGNAIGPDTAEIRVVDPKRRRVDLSHNSVASPTQAHDTNMEIQMITSTDPKNELLAGAALQTRQSL